MHIAITLALSLIGALVLVALIAGVLYLIERRARPRSFLLNSRTPALVDVLKAGGFAPMFDGPIPEITWSALDGALKALNCSSVASYPFSTQQHELLVEPIGQSPELDRLEVSVHDCLEIRLTDRLFRRKRYARAHQQKVIADIVRHFFLPVVKKDIVVHFCNGEAQPEFNDADFHVLIKSANSTRRKVTPPAEVFGIAVSKDSTVYAESGDGDTFYDQQSNHVFAQLFDNRLFIFYGPDDAADPVQGLALLVRVLEHAVAQLNIESLVSSVVQELRLAKTIAGAKDFSVFDQGFKGRRQTVAKALVKAILAPAVQQEILLMDCRGNNHDPLTDGMLHVFCDSSPLGSETQTAPGKLWGLRQGKNQRTYLPSGMGLLLADNTGFPVGELFEQNLYVYLDLLPTCSIRDARLFARFLQEAAAVVTASRSSEKEVLDASFENECVRQAAVSAAEAGAKAKASLALEAKAAGDELTAKIKQVRAAEREFFRLSETSTLELGAEFDEIVKIRKVLDVKVSGSGLTIFTDVLYCVDPRSGIKHEIGAFEITFPTDPKKKILWKNKTRKVKAYCGDNWYGPHIDDSGHACLGTVKDVFPKLLEKREFASAVELGIAFVESVNVNDDSGRYINLWPVAHGAS